MRAAQLRAKAEDEPAGSGQSFITGLEPSLHEGNICAAVKNCGGAIRQNAATKVQNLFFFLFFLNQCTSATMCSSSNGHWGLAPNAQQCLTLTHRRGTFAVFITF